MKDSMGPEAKEQCRTLAALGKVRRLRTSSLAGIQ